MTNQEVEKYRRPVRILHWVHSGAFVVLFLTGLVLFIPQLAFLAEDSWTRLLHRIGAAIFIVVPLLYLVVNPKAAGRGLKTAFTWGIEDMDWLRAAPRYYFLGDEKAMPPQGSLNSGQKMWWFLTIICGAVFIITGLVIWFGRAAAPPALLQWAIFLHDVVFIVAGAMFFVHLYLGVFHPLMTEAWKAMASGKISVEYAREHHGKWYDEVSKSREKPAE